MRSPHILAAALAFVASAAFATPVINQITVDGPYLRIYGESLISNSQDRVYIAMDGSSEMYEPQLMTSTDTYIEVYLETMPPAGQYRLFIRPSDKPPVTDALVVFGAIGQQGEQGVQGETGAVGPIGAVGPEGPEGPQGVQGLAGADGVSGADGATGPAGPPGPMGLQGPVGAVGPQGPAGADGLDGEDGAPGPVGPQGPPGPTAPMSLEWVDSDGHRIPFVSIGGTATQILYKFPESDLPFVVFYGAGTQDFVLVNVVFTDSSCGADGGQAFIQGDGAFGTQWYAGRNDFSWFLPDRSFERRDVAFSSYHRGRGEGCVVLSGIYRNLYPAIKSSAPLDLNIHPPVELRWVAQ